MCKIENAAGGGKMHPPPKIGLNDLLGFKTFVSAFLRLSRFYELNWHKKVVMEYAFSG